MLAGQIAGLRHFVIEHQRTFAEVRLAIMRMWHGVSCFVPLLAKLTRRLADRKRVEKGGPEPTGLQRTDQSSRHAPP